MTDEFESAILKMNSHKCEKFKIANERGYSMGDGELLFFVEKDEDGKIIIIRPMQNGGIVLYGPEWAEMLIELIRQNSHELWGIQL